VEQSQEKGEEKEENIQRGRRDRGLGRESKAKRAGGTTPLYVRPFATFLSWHGVACAFHTIWPTRVFRVSRESRCGY